MLGDELGAQYEPGATTINNTTTTTTDSHEYELGPAEGETETSTAVKSKTIMTEDKNEGVLGYR
jgi:hypothetical protein